MQVDHICFSNKHLSDQLKSFTWQWYLVPLIFKLSLPRVVQASGLEKAGTVEGRPACLW